MNRSINHDASPMSSICFEVGTYSTGTIEKTASVRVNPLPEQRKQTPLQRRCPVMPEPQQRVHVSLIMWRVSVVAIIGCGWLMRKSYPIFRFRQEKSTATESFFKTPSPLPWRGSRACDRRVAGCIAAFRQSPRQGPALAPRQGRQCE